MGLCIYYNGIIDDQASLSGMIKEVKDIAEAFDWKYFVFDKVFPEGSIGKTFYNDNIYGINFTPPGCETLDLCFLSNGRMSSYVNLKFYGNSKDEDEQNYLYMLSTKTQYAGIETHKIIIHLLKYLSKKYFKEFNLSDEGEYWETGDEKLLEEKFRLYNALIENVADAIKNYSMVPGETFEQYFLRVMQQIHKKRQ